MNTIKIEGILEKFSEEAKRRKRDKTDVIMQIDNFSSRIDQMQAQTAYHSESINNLGEITGTLLELSHIGNLLDSQDEEDRRNISLWGMYEKDRTKDYQKSIDLVRKSNIKEKLQLSKIANPIGGKYNVVTIDKDCHSCTNSNPAVLSAFKMA